MNTLKTAAARFARLAPQGQMRWVKLAIYALVFLLPFGMALIALLVYLDQRKRVTATSSPALPAPVNEVAGKIAATPAPAVPRTGLSHYCSNAH